MRAQQNFEIVGGLNPVQLETEDDRQSDKYVEKKKNVTCKITPLGILFLSIKNNTEQVFITSRE